MRLPPDFDPAWILAFLGARAVPGLELVASSGYQRTVALESGPAWLVAAFDGPMLRTDEGSQSRRLVRWLFDLDADLTDFLELGRRDRVLGPMIRRRPGLRRPLALDPFESIVRAVVGQLVSVAAATTIIGRLVHRFGPSVEIDGARRLVFPRPSDLIAAKADRLAQLGMPRSKATTLMGIAERCVRGDLDWTALREDPGRADAVLQQIPGVGPWTSAYVRWRALGDPDAFPSTDLGIVKALAERGVDRGAIGPRTDKWRPWRGFAVAHLWASLAD